jgi:hypothetical protein
MFEDVESLEGQNEFKVEFHPSTASVSISAPSHGSIPQNNNQPVHGVSE